MIDLYCERTTAELWAEPLNAITNAAFLIAAIIAWQDLRRRPTPRDGVTLLPALMAATGLGSLSFHLFASALTQFLDVGALLLFQLVYLWCYLAMLGHNRWLRMLLVTAFVGAVVALSPYSSVANGSLIYLPTLVALVVFVAVHRTYRRDVFPLILTSVVLFSLSLLSRSVDMMLCEQVAVGTHFIWHLLNAVVMVLMFRALLGLQQNVRSAAT